MRREGGYSFTELGLKPSEASAFIPRSLLVADLPAEQDPWTYVLTTPVPGFESVPYENGWYAPPTGSGGVPQTMFRVHERGICFLEVSAAFDNWRDNLNSSTWPIFTLPPEARPTSQVAIPVIESFFGSNLGALNAHSLPLKSSTAEILVQTDGVVRLRRAVSTALSLTFSENLVLRTAGTTGRWQVS